MLCCDLGGGLRLRLFDPVGAAFFSKGGHALGAFIRLEHADAPALGLCKGFISIPGAYRPNQTLTFFDRYRTAQVNHPDFFLDGFNQIFFGHCAMRKTHGYGITSAKAFAR